MEGVLGKKTSRSVETEMSAQTDPRAWSSNRTFKIKE